MNKLLILVFVGSLLQAQSEYDKYPQCDGVDIDGIVHHEKKNGKLDNFEEIKCAIEEELKEKDRELSDIEKRIAEGEKRIAEGEKQIAEGEKRIAEKEKRIAEGEKRIAEFSKDNIEFIKLIAMLDPQELKKHIKRIELKIANESNTQNKKRLEGELKLIKSELRKRGLL